MFTNLIITKAEVEDREAQARASFAANRGGDFDANLVRLIGERIQKRPSAHLEFGPYWWAVKQVLNAGGFPLGKAGDPLVAASYRGDTDTQTLVAAELFKDHYRRTFMAGTAAFDLSDDGELYLLEDPDMAARLPTA